MDQQAQLEYFRQAVDLLGGQRPTARAIGVAERTIRALLSGERQLHPGFLQDAATALLEHAEQCRKLERLISPAFSGNLTAEQRERRPHGNAYHLRRED